MVSVNTAVRRTCPSWCTVSHRRQRGEDDLVHIGEAVPLSGAILARLCMSVTPDGEVDDGPYVLVGSDELTLEEARRLGERLVAMADEGKQVSRRGGA